MGDPDQLPDTTVLDPVSDLAFLRGYQSGFLAGVERGRELEEAELAAIQRRAAEVTHGMAKLGEWPEQVARAQQAQRDSVARFREAVQGKGAA